MNDYPTLAIPLTNTERDTLTNYEDYLAQQIFKFFQKSQNSVLIS